MRPDNPLREIDFGRWDTLRELHAEMGLDVDLDCTDARWMWGFIESQSVKGEAVRVHVDSFNMWPPEEMESDPIGAEVFRWCLIADAARDAWLVREMCIGGLSFWFRDTSNR